MFKKYHLSDDAVKKLFSDFSSVLFVNLMANAKELDDQEIQNLKILLEQKNINAVLKVLELKYSKKEWQSYLEGQAIPLLEDYVKNVVQV